jgi:hypothetical protein
LPWWCPQALWLRWPRLCGRRAGRHEDAGLRSVSCGILLRGAGQRSHIPPGSGNDSCGGCHGDTDADLAGLRAGLIELQAGIDQQRTGVGLLLAGLYGDIDAAGASGRLDRLRESPQAEPGPISRGRAAGCSSDGTRRSPRTPLDSTTPTLSGP